MKVQHLYRNNFQGTQNVALSHGKCGQRKEERLSEDVFVFRDAKKGRFMVLNKTTMPWPLHILMRKGTDPF